MATVNNRNQSSSGVSLELSIARDADIGLENFNDQLSRIEVTPHKKFEFYAIKLDDRDPFEFTDPTQYDFTREQLNRAISRRDVLLADLTASLGKSPLSSRVSKAKLLEEIRALLSDQELAAFFFENFAQHFEIVQCHGYSQGDFCCVVYGREDVADMVRAHGEIWREVIVGAGDIREELSAVIYSQPVWGRFTVSAGAYNREYMIDEYMASAYEYDRGEILKNFEARHAGDPHFIAAINFLSDHLPDDPDGVRNVANSTAPVNDGTHTAGGTMAGSIQLIEAAARCDIEEIVQLINGCDPFLPDCDADQDTAAGAAAFELLRRGADHSPAAVDTVLDGLAEAGAVFDFEIAAAYALSRLAVYNGQPVGRFGAVCLVGFECVQYLEGANLERAPVQPAPGFVQYHAYELINGSMVYIIYTITADDERRGVPVRSVSAPFFRIV